MNRQLAVLKLLSLAVAVVPAVVATAAGCTKPDPAPTSNTSTAGSASLPPKVNTTGAVIYKERCAACHGAEGKGDGAAAAAINPKPRNHTDKAWQASVSDEEIRKTILLGGAGVGKSPMMPGAPDLAGSPEVIDELVKIVRGFGK